MGRVTLNNTKTVHKPVQNVMECSFVLNVITMLNCGDIKKVVHISKYNKN
jgi:hypothetical protein